MEAVKKKNRRSSRKRAANAQTVHGNLAPVEQVGVCVDATESATLDAAASGDSSPGEEMMWDAELDGDDNAESTDGIAATPSLDSIEPLVELRNEDPLAQEQEHIDQDELLAAITAVTDVAEDDMATGSEKSADINMEEASAPPCESDAVDNDLTTSEASAANSVPDLPAYPDSGIENDGVDVDASKSGLPSENFAQLQGYGSSLPPPITYDVPSVQIPMMPSSTVAPSAPSFSDSEEDPHHHMFPASEESTHLSFQRHEVPRPPEIPIGLLRKASTHVATVRQENGMVSPGATTAASLSFSDSLSTHSAPSAPPDLEVEDEHQEQKADHAPSAPSLSPTAAKMRESMVMTPKRRKPEHLQTESASVTLRNSYAKTRMSEATRRLYPMVLEDNASSTAEVKSGVPAEKSVHFDPKLLAPKQRVCIKLEPHVNFEMNLLRAEAAQKRQEVKMKNIATNKGELYSRLERYLYAEYLLHTAASTMDTYKKDIDVLIQKVWALETKRLSSTQRCGDHVEIDQQLEFQTAKLEPNQLNKLKAHLDRLRQLRTMESSLHTFDRAMAYFHVEQYLNNVLHEPHLVSFLNRMSASCVGLNNGVSTNDSMLSELEIVPAGINFYEALPAGSTLANSVDHVKYCLDVMVFFEKQVTLDIKGFFGRVPHSFYRGELVWHSSNSRGNSHNMNGGMERKVKCYACGSLNSPMDANQWCKPCERCDVVLFLPPTSISTTSNEWFSSVLRFRQSLQKWISTCMRSLLRTKSLGNMPYLLMHVLYLPRIATEERSWMLRFLQFPRAMITAEGTLKQEWSEDLVDHYIAMLHLVFHPEKLRRMSVLVSSGITNDISAYSTSNGEKERPNGGVVSPEWVLLENPEVLDRYFLSDDDFVAVLNQFPNSFAFEQVFRCTLDAKRCFCRALTLVLELTQSLRVFQEFEKLPARIAQLLGQLLMHASEVPISRSVESMASEAIFYPTLFDQLFLTALHGLLVADCNRIAWKSLRHFPFGSLSELAKWDVLALLLFNVHFVPDEAKTSSGWKKFIDKHSTGQGTTARGDLYEQIATDTENAVHLLNAVASLAASSTRGSEIGRDGVHRVEDRNDLVIVAVHELFLAGFTVSACQQALGESGDRAAVPISTICLAHPWVISQLITLLFQYHECAATWIHVFETFPINRWVPTSLDLMNIQEWLLLENTLSPRCALARFLLDRMNWEYDLKNDRLFTSAYLHRQVALIVAEGLVLYKARTERANDLPAAILVSGSGAPQKLHVSSITQSIRRALWLEESVDFPQWCWKIMLKLKFYSPETREPLIELIDLLHDRSREAITLRRWFSGGADQTALTSKVPFFVSLETELAGLGVSKAVQIDLPPPPGGLVTANASFGTPIKEGFLGSAENGNMGNTNSTVAVAQMTEPIVAYVICQMTTFLYSDRVDRWEPLLVLLKEGIFSAVIKVLENIFPILSKFDRMKRGIGISQSDEKQSNTNDSENGHDHVNTTALAVDHEVDICMAAMQQLTTDELLQCVHVLGEYSYINAEERQRMESILHQGYIGGWENTAKAKILAKLRFVRECSRYLHPIVLPALINELFPQSNPVALTTSALLHGAISWISSTLRGGAPSGPLSPTSSTNLGAALSVRKSSLIATASAGPTVGAAAAAATLGMLASPAEYSASTKSICNLIERGFGYSSNSSSLRDVIVFWMRTVLQVPFWYENHEFRHVVDVIFRCAMEQLVDGQSGSKYQRKSFKANASSDPILLFELASILQVEFNSFCLQLKDRNERPDLPQNQIMNDELLHIVSFLPAIGSSTTFASLFGGACDVAQYVGGCSYLSLWILLVETRQELPLFMTMGQLMMKYESKAMKKLEKMKKSKGKIATELAQCGLNTLPSLSMGSNTKCLVFSHTNFDSLSEFKFYRWCEYCLEIPEHDDVQIVYWQVFFALYFSCAGGSHIFGYHFLDRHGSHKAKRVHLRKNLQAKLRRMANYCSTQAQVVLTSVNNGLQPMSADMKEKKYQHFVTLSQIYTAMDAWLEEKDPNGWLQVEELVALPRHFEVKRLQEVLALSDALLSLSPNEVIFAWSSVPLWMDLCGFEFTMQPKFSKQSTALLNEDGDMLESITEGSILEVQEEEDFAFVEDAADLRRRHSSFGGHINGDGIKPLALSVEHCGPASLTLLPTVSLSFTEDGCIVTPSIPLNKHGLKNVAVKFSENLSILVALDAEVMDHVMQLYSSKTRVVTQNRSCIEGPNCRKPASFRFEFLEWTMDKRLSDAIQTVVSQATRCDMKSMAMTNISSLLEDEHHQLNLQPNQATGAAPHQEVDQFLKLDADGIMLTVQILLIDQIVRTLDYELEKTKREQQLVAGSSSTKETGSEEEEAALQEEKKIEQQMERLHERGLEWFRSLTELDTKLSRMVPPLREVLWRSIKQLGASFVCVDERETCTLLQLMLEDPTRITLLSECFFPVSAPSRFVEMFSKLMSVSGSAKLSSEEKLILVRRFDFSQWLQTKSPHTPTKFDRETVVCIILNDISANFVADRSLVTASTVNGNGVESQSKQTEYLDEVLRVYSRILHSICSAHLEDHAEKVLHALVGVHDDYRFHNQGKNEENVSGLTSLPRPAAAAVWEAIVTIPQEAWQKLPYMQIEACVAFFSHHMTSLRWQSALSSPTASNKDAQYPIVYWQRLGILKHFLDLFTIFNRIAPESQQWQLITTFFEPLLSTLYQPASTTEGSSINCPWSDQDTFSSGVTLCSCFVATCSEYLKGKPSSVGSAPALTDKRANSLSVGAKLTQIWVFYLNVLVPHAPVHICKHFHQFLTRLGWENWCLTLEVVQQMRESVQSEKQQLLQSTSLDARGLSGPSSSPYPFVSWIVRDILCRMTWKTTDEWLSGQSEPIRSVFLLEFAKLCVELVLDYPHFNPRQAHAVRHRTTSSSNNVLPPYFVNFIKQQPTLWSTWKMSQADLETLLYFTLESLKEPLHDSSAYHEGQTSSLFPSTPNAALMQDAFTRLQLVLRLLSQVTTIHHSAISKKECFSRVDSFIKMIYGVYESADLEGATNGRTDQSAWLMVLYGASCTVFYEKLDEIVQFFRKDSHETGENEDNNVADSVLTETLIGILRFCNLSLVTPFFKKHQLAIVASGTSALTCNWAKTGNVIFVEIDGMVRDFAATQKSLSQSKLSDQNTRNNNELTEAAPSGLLAIEAVGQSLGRLLWSFLAFRGGELGCLAACGRAIASVHVMSQISEKSIEKWIIEDRRGSWDDLVERLKVPELSQEEFETACLELGSLMTLQVLFLQQLRKAPVMTEAFCLGMLSKLMHWMEKMHLMGANSWTEMKILFFAAEVTNFVCKPLADVLPAPHKKQMLRQLCNILLRFGNARKNHGIMKAIGMGGSLKHNVEFHVSCLTIGVFLRLQTRTSTPLRTDERIPWKLTRTSEKQLKALEQLLTTKDCFHLGKRMDWMLEFVRNPKRSLADQDEFFVSLFSRMYPSHSWLLAKCTHSNGTATCPGPHSQSKREEEGAEMSMRKSLTLFTALLLALVATMSAVQAEPRAHASHILVDTEAEADEMHAQLREAKNVFATFAVLAKEHSKCPSSKKGGDLGKFGRGQMVPQFDKVVFEEEVGVVHKVQTQFGWHLVLISTRFDSDDEPDQGFEYYLAYYVNKASPFMGPIIIIIIMYFGNRSANKPMGTKARASHILVKTEAEADELLKQITAAKEPKKKLAELAAEKSTCPSGKKGGDLGMFGPGQMVPAFDKVVFSAEIDTFHKVQTQFGWHVLVCTERYGDAPKTDEKTKKDN